MREAFPTKGEYKLAESLDHEFEEQLKKNLEQSSPPRTSNVGFSGGAEQREAPAAASRG